MFSSKSRSPVRGNVAESQDFQASQAAIKPRVQNIQVTWCPNPRSPLFDHLLCYYRPTLWSSTRTWMRTRRSLSYWEASWPPLSIKLSSSTMRPSRRSWRMWSIWNMTSANSKTWTSTRITSSDSRCNTWSARRRRSNRALSSSTQESALSNTKSASSERNHHLKRSLYDEDQRGRLLKIWLPSTRARGVVSSLSSEEMQSPVSLSLAWLVFSWINIR